uniref:Renilla-type engineered ancestral luciferase variant (AncFT7) n=1 Tax=synthetic construct TaxID=32630 RepID=UPI002023BB7F|nr:Chain A, Renilla-type engineered ancestral luciferase variant (AncFT7) [synthetic construct]
MVSASQRTTSTATGDEWWAKCKQVDVLDSEMSYYDSDPGKHKNTVIFLHGNPTSSYLWRNVIPHVEPLARCLAPDLIGMGKSGKLPNHSYRFVDHYRYLSAWFDSVNLPEKVTIVCHDWGSGLGFHWCNEHRDRVKGIVHMESVVDVIESWDEWPDIEEDIALIKSEAGEEMVLKKNFFIERLLPSSIMRKLSEEEMDAYREPFVEPGESRRPTLTWPREIPLVKGGKPDVIEIVKSYNKWLSTSKDIPKLFINADPGFFSNAIKKVTKNWPNQKTVTVKGLHFLQEDSPEEIGEAIADFLNELTKHHHHHH